MMQEVAEKNGWTKFVSMQPEYSLIYREEVRASEPFFSHKLNIKTGKGNGTLL
jgi:hypothetical protein